MAQVSDRSANTRYLKFAIWVCVPFVVFMLIYSVTLQKPYHYDTAAYMKTAEDFLATGEIKHNFETRPMPSYVLLLFTYLFGERALALAMSVMYVLAALIYLQFNRRLFLDFAGSGNKRGKGASQHIALFLTVAAVFMTPASLMSTTHGKEDFISVFFYFASAVLVSYPGYRYALAGGILFCFALLAKEAALICIPFLVGLIILTEMDDEVSILGSLKSLRFKRIVLKLLLFGLAFLICLFIFEPDYFTKLMQMPSHPSTGMYLGVFSYMQSKGISLFRRGVGEPLFYLQAVALIVPFLEPSRRMKMLAVILIFQSLVLAVFFTNLAGVRYRHFIWPSLFLFPLIFRGVLLSFQKVRIPSVITVIVLLLFAYPLYQNLKVVMPVIELRNKYNPVAEFYSHLDVNPEKSILLGEDNCMLASYYSKIPCISPPKDAYETQARAMTQMIREWLDDNKHVYMLHDYFGYDKRGTLIKEMNDNFFKIKGNRQWHEDYHGLEFGYDIGEATELLSKKYPECSVSYITKTSLPDKIYDNLSVAEFLLDCADRRQAEKYFVVESFWGERVNPALNREGLFHIYRK